MICLLMEKIFKAKTPPGDFKVITPENSLLSQQAVTSKRISIPFINLQLNPYPNTHLDLFCSNNLSFSMHSSQYVTNQYMHRFKYVTNHQLEKDVGCKVLQFINTMKITKLLGYKPYDIQMQQLLKQEDKLRHMSLVTICLCKTFCIKLYSLASNFDGP